MPCWENCYFVIKLVLLKAINKIKVLFYDNTLFCHETLTKFQNKLVKIIGTCVDLLFHNVIICLRPKTLTLGSLRP